MAYTNEHVLMQFRGSIAPDEIWSCGLRSGPISGGIPETFLQEVADGARNAWAAFHVAAESNLSEGTLFTGVDARRVNVAGRTVALATANTVAATAGAGQRKHPNQVAVVATLASDTPGRAGKGRIYLPCLSASINPANGRLNPGTPAQIAASAKTMLDALNAVLAVAMGSEVCVQSRAAVNGGPHAVRTVRIGDVMDTQRRRRNGQLETYATATLF